MAILTARGLRKAYASDGATAVALAGVDLDVERGEFVAVMGPSGSGKSTLLHMLGGLDTPDDGEVSLDGSTLTALSRHDLALVRRRQVGFVFQFFNLVPVLTAEENVALPTVLEGTTSDQARGRIDELFGLFGLDDHRAKLPSQMSGGEQQRVAIARALVNKPAVLLADEPTGNLDRTAGNGVMSLLQRVNNEGETIVVVTHDPAVATHAQRVVFMRDGLLVDEARPAGDTSVILAGLARLEE